MDALIFEIKHFAVHDGDGIRTTVFFAGCPLRCVWCHNPEGLSASPKLAYLHGKCTQCGACVRVCPAGAHRIEDGAHIFARSECTGCGKCARQCPASALRLYGRRMSAAELLTVLLEDRDFYESSGGGVTLSGGECLMQAQFCADLLAALKREGIRTAVDTCGFVPRSALEAVLPYTDRFLYDIKAIDSAVHRRCTGQPNDVILENLRFLAESGAQTEVRIPYVPGFNDDQIEKIGAFLAPLRGITGVRVLPYHNYAASKYASLDMENTLPERMPEDAEITAAEECLHAFGLRVIN